MHQITHFSSFPPIWNRHQEPVTYGRVKFKAQQFQYFSMMLKFWQFKNVRDASEKSVFDVNKHNFVLCYQNWLIVYVLTGYLSLHLRVIWQPIC